MNNYFIFNMYFTPYPENLTANYKPEGLLEQNHRQPRTFQSPLLLLLAATLLAKVSGKTYEYQSPWIPYKPYLPYYQLQNPHSSLWYPISGHSELSSEVPPHHVQLRPPSVTQHQIINIHEAASEETYTDTRDRNRHVITNIERPAQEIADEIAHFEPDIQESVDNEPAAANVQIRRQKPDSSTNKRTTSRYMIKRGSEQKNRRYSNHKRVNRRPYYTTTYPSYDSDYYDEYDTRIKQRRRTTTKRPKRRTTTRIYDDYDDYEYDESSDSSQRITTKTGNKRRRKPTRNNNKNRRKPVEDSSEYYQNRDSEENFQESEEYPNYPFEIVPQVAQRQVITTTSASTGTDTDSTGESTVTTESSTTVNSTGGNGTNNGYGYGPNSLHNNNVSIAYGPPGPHYYNYDYNNPSGYGPSNGNENISITYGPPTGHRLEYVAPLLDAWYSQYAAKNAVVRRIQDLLHNNQIYNNQGANYNDNAF